MGSSPAAWGCSHPEAIPDQLLLGALQKVVSRSSRGSTSSPSEDLTEKDVLSALLRIGSPSRSGSCTQCPPHASERDAEPYSEISLCSHVVQTPVLGFYVTFCVLYLAGLSGCVL